MRLTKKLNVTKLKYCCQCGTCEVVCPNVRIKPANLTNCKDKNQDFWPEVHNLTMCANCSHHNCLKCCPIYDNEHELHTWFGPQVKPEDYNFGKFNKLVIGYSKDKIIASKAASGGMVTTIVKYLMETKQVKGAIMVTPDPDNPSAGQFVVIDNPDDIQKACSSKYAAIPFNHLLTKPFLTKEKGPYVLVGRPCQIRAVHKAAKVFPAIEKNIAFTISLFCAWLISKKGIDFLFSASGITSEDKIKSVDYRGGGWPGTLTIETDKEVKKFPIDPKKYHTFGTYYYPSVTPFVPPACRHCFDIVGSQADISAGDPWNLGLDPGVEHGYTILISRTKKAEKLLADPLFLEKYANITFQPNINHLTLSQGGILKFKQLGGLLGKLIGKAEKPVQRYLFVNQLYNKIVKLLFKFVKPKYLTKYYLDFVWKTYKVGINKLHKNFTDLPLSKKK